MGKSVQFGDFPIRFGAWVRVRDLGIIRIYPGVVMADVYPAGVCWIQVVIQYQYNQSGTMAETVLFYTSATAVALDSAALNIANVVGNYYTTAVAPILSSNIQFVGVQVRMRDALNIGEGENNTAVAGTVGGAPLPDVVALIVNKRAGGLSRGRFGRVFHPGISEAWCVNANEIDPSHLPPVSAFYQGLCAGSVATGVADAVHVLWNRNTGATLPVLFYEAAGSLRTQRRRTPGRGI